MTAPEARAPFRRAAASEPASSPDRGSAGSAPIADLASECCAPVLGCAPAIQAGQGLWGWSPPLLPSNAGLARWTDRLLPRTGFGVVVYFGTVIALLNLAPHLPYRVSLAVDGVAALVGGAWCALNFWRCRHAHCLVTGGGWLVLSLFAFAEAALGRSLVAGDEQVILLGILAAGLVFELLWWRSRGTNAVGGGPA